MKQFKYDVGEDRQLIQGQWADLGVDEEGNPNPMKQGLEDGVFWVTDQQHMVGVWALDDNDIPQEYQDTEALALIAIQQRQRHAPMLIAKISLKITSEGVDIAERMALNPLVSTVTVLLQSGSYQDALAAVTAQPTEGLSDAAKNVLSYTTALLQDAVSNYY